MLYIRHYKIAMAYYLIDLIPGSIQACLNCSIYRIFLAELQNLSCEIRVMQRLPARKSHSASGSLLVKWFEL